MKWLNALIHYSLHNKPIVLLGVVLLVVGGWWSIDRMDIDVFPDLTAPTVVVMTDAHGMAAEEVEQLVTFPIETAVNGATNVRRVRSASLQGHSLVWAEFNWGMDIHRARQIISEKMSTLRETLPEGIQPQLAPQSSIMGEIMFVSLQSDTTSLMDLRTLADWVIKPAILATGGVSQVTNTGGEERQYQILANPQRMAAYRVTMNELADVGRSWAHNSVGGIINDYGNEYVLRGMARETDLQQLGNSLVKMHNGHPVFVSDVAEVKIGKAVPLGCASRNGKPAVLLSVSKQPNINTLDVTKRIVQHLEDIQQTLPADVHLDTHIFRQADFIQNSVSNVREALLEGALFAILILILFLGNLRTTLISVLAIPLSLLGTCIILHLCGMNVNTMTLGGMCIAIGSLVDDAIIDVENVYRRLRQNNALPESSRQPALTVVYEASKEIRSSIFNATLIIISSFLPLFFLSGMEGRMLQPLGIAFVLSLGMSLLVAMTVTPILCHELLSGEKHLQQHKKDSRIVIFLRQYYQKSLEWVLGNKRVVLAGALCLFLISLLLLMRMGMTFLPDFNEGAATVTAVTRPGTSLEVNDAMGKRLETALKRVPEVAGTARRTGRGELDEHSLASYSSEIEVQFKPSHRSRLEIFEEMRKEMAKVPGVVTTIGQPLGHRIDHMLSGTRANIAIKIFGPDLTQLYRLGTQIQQTIVKVPGVVDINVEQQVETPQIQLCPNRIALAQHGITVADFNRFVEQAFSGEKLADLCEGQRQFDITLRLTPTGMHGEQNTLRVLRDALIDTPNGTKIPLAEVAEIKSVGGPYSISRENVERKLVVSSNSSGRDLGSIVKEIREKIAETVSLPEGYRIEYGGQFENAQSATRTLLLTSLLALLLIFMLLYIEFRNISLSALVLLNLPFALIGGVAAVWITSSVVSIPAIIGFITLFGIATRNGILLISHYGGQNTPSTDAQSSLRQTIIERSSERLNPILMTALSSALALIPLVIFGERAGNEIQSPMAIVVLGGLITSTLLNVYLMPLAYEWYIRRRQQKQSANLLETKA